MPTTASAQHTPGPWFASREDRETWKVGSEDYGTRLAVLHDPYGTSPIEANARLIAAAPEMLEALRGAVKEIEHLQGLLGEAAEGGPSLKYARAAIAKAEERAS